MSGVSEQCSSAACYHLASTSAAWSGVSRWGATRASIVVDDDDDQCSSTRCARVCVECTAAAVSGSVLSPRWSQVFHALPDSTIIIGPFGIYSDCDYEQLIFGRRTFLESTSPELDLRWWSMRFGFTGVQPVWSNLCEVLLECALSSFLVISA